MLAKTKRARQKQSVFVPFTNLTFSLPIPEIRTEQSASSKSLTNYYKRTRRPIEFVLTIAPKIVQSSLPSVDFVCRRDQNLVATTKGVNMQKIVAGIRMRGLLSCWMAYWLMAEINVQLDGELYLIFRHHPTPDLIPPCA